MRIETSEVGTVTALWRHPVKSMLGEEISSSHVAERGLAGDRAYALVDPETGKAVSAKNPRKWPLLFSCRAALVHPPAENRPIPAVRIRLPSGKEVTSNDAGAGMLLSRELGRAVNLASAASNSLYIEQYWPDIEGMRYRETVTNMRLAEHASPGSFFDGAPIHVLTTASLDRLQQLAPNSRMDPRRFRPNLLLASPPGVEGFVENDWTGRTIAVGEQVRLAILDSVARCVMITLAQNDLPADLAILQAVVRHNTIFRAGKGRSAPCLGAFAKVLRGGLIRQGDLCRLE